MADSYKMLQELSRKLADDGKLVESGWVAFRMIVLPLDTPGPKIESMRLAYMAGAQHTFASMLGILEAGEEPTDKDMSRMSKLNDEVNDIVEKTLKPRLGKRGTLQ